MTSRPAHWRLNYSHHASPSITTPTIIVRALTICSMNVRCISLIVKNRTKTIWNQVWVDSQERTQTGTASKVFIKAETLIHKYLGRNHTESLNGSVYIIFTKQHGIGLHAGAKPVQTGSVHAATHWTGSHMQPELAGTPFNYTLAQFTDGLVNLIMNTSHLPGNQLELIFLLVLTLAWTHRIPSAGKWSQWSSVATALCRAIRDLRCIYAATERCMYRTLLFKSIQG